MPEVRKLMINEYGVNICPVCKKAIRFDYKGNILEGDNLKRARDKLIFVEAKEDRCEGCK